MARGGGGARAGGGRYALEDIDCVGVGWECVRKNGFSLIKRGNLSRLKRWKGERHGWRLLFQACGTVADAGGSFEVCPVFGGWHVQAVERPIDDGHHAPPVLFTLFSP